MKFILCVSVYLFYLLYITSCRSVRRQTVLTTGDQKPLLISPSQKLPAEGAPQKLIVIFPGSGVAPDQYVTLAHAMENIVWINSEHLISLYVAILPSDAAWIPVPNMQKIKDYLTVCKDLVESDPSFNGGSGPKSSSSAKAGLSFEKDVFLSGHSLGGVVVGAAVPQLPFKVAGTILFGSYLDISKSSGGSIAKWHASPLLEIAGGLDGLTKPTRIAFEMMNLYGADAQRQVGILDRAIVLLRSVTHSQFCSKANISAFGHRDVEPQISLEKAQMSIAVVTANFFILHSLKNRKVAHEAYEAMMNDVAKTKSYFKLYLPTLDEEAESSRCIDAQLNIAHLEKSPVTKKDIKLRQEASLTRFVFDKPSISKAAHNKSLINIYSTIYHRPYALQLVENRWSVEQLACKAKSRSAIIRAFDVKGAKRGVAKNPCQYTNVKTFHDLLTHLSSVDHELYDNYMKKGTQMIFGVDKVSHTGPGWLASPVQEQPSFNRAANKSIIIIHSPSLETGARMVPKSYREQHYCKLLPKSRIMEWVLIDSMIPS